jgi:hypothetical protein
VIYLLIEKNNDKGGASAAALSRFRS